MCPLSPTASTRAEPSGCTWITVRLACATDIPSPRRRIDLQRLHHQVANDVAVRDEDVVALGVLGRREELARTPDPAAWRTPPAREQPRLGCFMQRRRAFPEQRDCVNGTFDSVSCITAAVSRARCNVLDVMESNETPRAAQPRGDQARLRDAQWRETRAELRIGVAIGDVRAVANQVNRCAAVGCDCARSRSRPTSMTHAHTSTLTICTTPKLIYPALRTG